MAVVPVADRLDCPVERGELRVQSWRHGRDRKRDGKVLTVLQAQGFERPVLSGVSEESANIAFANRARRRLVLDERIAWQKRPETAQRARLLVATFRVLLTQQQEVGLLWLCREPEFGRDAKAGRSSLAQELRKDDVVERSTSGHGKKLPVPSDEGGDSCARQP